MSRQTDSVIWFCDHYNEETRQLDCGAQEWESAAPDGTIRKTDGWSYGPDDGDDTESYCPDHFGENDSVAAAAVGGEA